METKLRKYKCLECKAGTIRVVHNFSETHATAKIGKCTNCKHQYIFNALKYLTEINP